MKHTLISAMLCMTVATSCVDMDIEPKNIVTSESLISNESGMDIYMARMYSLMPWEDPTGAVRSNCCAMPIT